MTATAVGLRCCDIGRVAGAGYHEELLELLNAPATTGRLTRLLHLVDQDTGDGQLSDMVVRHWDFWSTPVDVWEAVQVFESWLRDRSEMWERSREALPAG